MKKRNLFVTLGLALGLGIAGLTAATLSSDKVEREVKAEVISTGFKGGEAFYVVDEIGAFATTADGDGQLRAVFLNSDDSASSITGCIYEKTTDKDNKPVYRVVTPNYTKADGGSWTKLILSRYNVIYASDTAVVWNHSHNQSDDEDLTLFNGSYNTIYVWGWRSNTNKFEVSWGNIDGYNGPVSGTKMYAETGGWDQAGRKGLFAIYFFGALDGASYNASITLTDSLKVQGTGTDFSSGLWEFTVPYAADDKVVTWHQYNFVELKEGYDTLIWNSTNLYQSGNITIGKHNIIKGGNDSNYDVGNAQRAGYFASYFLAQTSICDDDGATDSSKLSTAWTNAKNQYPAVNSAALEFLSATGNEAGSTLEQAVARYDYIIGKYNTDSSTPYEDFAGRIAGNKVSLSGVRTSLINLTGMNSNNTLIVFAIAGVSLLALAGFFLLKRKEDR